VPTELHAENDLREPRVKRRGQKIKNKGEWAKGKEGEGCSRDVSNKKHKLTS
jgi:hypothetical protein